LIASNRGRAALTPKRFQLRRGANVMITLFVDADKLSAILWKTNVVLVFSAENATMI
jgi:hypothetical protein